MQNQISHKIVGQRVVFLHDDNDNSNDSDNSYTITDEHTQIHQIVVDGFSI